MHPSRRSSIGDSLSKSQNLQNERREEHLADQSRPKQHYGERSFREERLKQNKLREGRPASLCMPKPYHGERSYREERLRQSELRGGRPGSLSRPQPHHGERSFQEERLKPEDLTCGRSMTRVRTRGSGGLEMVQRSPVTHQPGEREVDQAFQRIDQYYTNEDGEDEESCDSTACDMLALTLAMIVLMIALYYFLSRLTAHVKYEPPSVYVWPMRRNGPYALPRSGNQATP